MSGFSDEGDGQIGQGLSTEQAIEYGLVLSSYFSADHENRFLYEKLLGRGKDGVTYLIIYRPRYAAVLAATRGRSRSPKEQDAPEEDFIDDEIPDEDLVALLSRQLPSTFDRPQTAPEPAKRRWRGVGWDEDSRGGRIVLKIDLLAIGAFFGNEFVSSNFSDASNNCEKEKGYLQIFRNCQHIAKLISIPEDPLAKTSSLLRAHLLSQSNWFFEEYLENGSMSTFITRLLEAYQKKGLTPTRLPNRVLWSIFLCLVKMVVAMAWPQQTRRDAPERCLLDKPISSIQHNDIHDGNLMFGNESHPDCHSLMPILKLIDFAGADTLIDDRTSKIGDKDSIPEGLSDNIFAIGKTMAILLLPDRWDHFGSEIYPERPATAQFYVPFMAHPIESVAVELANHDASPGIDSDLRELAFACLAVQPANRPGILELHEYVQQATNDRNEAYYQNLNDAENERLQQSNLPPNNIFDIELEKETYIRRLIGDLMLTPPASDA